VYLLFEKGYGGVAVEADENMRSVLEDNLSVVNSSLRVFASIETVTPRGVRDLLQRYEIQKDFDALKIDIDSFDLAVLREVFRAGYLPKVIMMELNNDFPPPFQFYEDYDPRFSSSWHECNGHLGHYGASADSIYKEFSTNGYSLVGIESWAYNEEHNMWFVRNDLLNRTSSEPLVSWKGMARMYWAQMGVGRECAFVQPCPLQSIRALVRDLHGNPHWPPSKMSYYLAQLHESSVASSVLAHWKTATAELSEKSFARCWNGSTISSPFISDVSFPFWSKSRSSM
jgi:hypothetical protein